MKRRRSSAPGRLRPDGRWTHSILLVALFAVLTAACGQATTTDSPTDTPPTSSGTAPTGTATTDPPTEAPMEPSVSAEPTPPGSAPPGSSANPSSGTGNAAACTGSDENRDFFASMAAAVGWTVYCPILPNGWFVEDGHYRLANGGWMEIGYDGPGDAGIVLRQGSFCEASDGCVPAGSEIGDTAFGDRTGRVVAVPDGSWAIVVDRGAVPSWLLVVQGLDEAAARTIAAELRAVTG